ncbi:MAG: dependent oxidoreductase [Acidobacteria bacterium]|nr:dependent oxidoreductase [Acidobacteriota bacterium]
MRIAVIGGGINGAGIAWELARRDYEVALFEKGEAGRQTSSATTKMIHGGLRYLEHFHVGLVREALHERGWLLSHLPQLVTPIEILLPIYDDSPRRRVTIALGLTLYDLLAGRGNVGHHRALSAAEIAENAPLVRDGLRGGFRFYDAQVDDYALVRLVLSSAIAEGAIVREQTQVTSLVRDGDGWIVGTNHGDTTKFDMIVNAAGPWMNELLAANGIVSRYKLSLVRGSHLILDRAVGTKGMLLQSNADRRVFFVLPWKGTTLVGTTEVVQREPVDRVHASDEEIDYLINRFNRYIVDPITRADVAETFSGVRPLVGRSTNPSAIGREYRLERHGNVINVFGGKMTTFMALARRVAMRVDNYAGHARTPREPRFVGEGMGDEA